MVFICVSAPRHTYMVIHYRVDSSEICAIFNPLCSYRLWWAQCHVFILILAARHVLIYNAADP